MSTDGRSSAPALTRRRLVAGAAGLVAAGTAGSVALDAAAASAAATGQPGPTAPAVVQLTDASVISVDASLGNDFRVTISGSRTMGNPANATDGQQIVFQITQGAGGPWPITWESGYGFSEELPQPTLSTTPGQTDLLGFVYNAAKREWLLAAFVNGFS